MFIKEVFFCSPQTHFYYIFLEDFKYLCHEQMTMEIVAKLSVVKELLHR